MALALGEKDLDTTEDLRDRSRDRRAAAESVGIAIVLRQHGP